MNKQAPSFGRLAVMIGFAVSCFTLLVFLWLAFGGPAPLQPEGYRVRVGFTEATQLASQADVRIAGVNVGKVEDIEPGPKGRSIATIELDPEYAPLRADARAMLREKTLLGETYVAITPGSRSAKPVPDGGALAPGRVATTVQLDEIFRSLPAARRADFRTWMQQLATGVRGRGQDINDAFGNLAPFAEDSTRILRILDSQSDALSRLVRNTGVVSGALGERGDQLRQLIRDSERVTATTAERNQALKAAFVALPTFLTESRTTLERVAGFSRKANPLVDQLHPVARELSPTLQDLDAVAPDLKALFRDLDPVITASAKGLPALDRFLSELEPVLDEVGPFTDQLTPILSFLGRYQHEITAFFANTVAATQATQLLPGQSHPVHYLRTQNPVNPENLAIYPNRLPTNRSNPYEMPGAFNDLKSGLPVFSDANCGVGGLPVVGPVVKKLLPGGLGDLVDKLVLKGGELIAPPCRQQGKFDVGGHVTQYPQVRALAGGAGG